MTENEIAEKIIGCAIRVHRTLGPGLLESAYVECLCYELKEHNISFEREKLIPLFYNDVQLDCGYRADILVEGKVIVQAKAVKNIDEVHLAQVLTYLKLSETKLGLLINFNVTLVKNGIRRVANDL